MNVVNIARFVVKTVSVVSVQQVVDNIIKVTTPETLTSIQMIQTRIAGVVISAYIGDVVGTYILDEWDKVSENFRKTSSETDGEPVIINAK